MSDFIIKLEEKMREMNFHIEGYIDIGSPKFQRFRNKNKLHKGKDLFVKILGNGEGAVFGDWHYRDQWVTWWEREWNTLNSSEKVQRKLAQEKFKRELIETRHDAMQRAKEFWNSADPPNEDHPYLKKKRILPYYCKQDGECLLIPVWNFAKQIQSIQFIYPNGFKRFMDDTTINYGCLFMMQKLPETLYLCEGYATGCSLNETFPQQVVVCFSASNLLNIALSLRQKLLNRDIVICADNDYLNEINTGLDCAMEAAKVSNSFLTFPNFDNLPSFKFEEISKPSDFNDLFCLSGIEEVERQVLENKRFLRNK